MSNDSWTEFECYDDVPTRDDLRVILVAVIGTLFCFTGVLFNSFLLVILVKLPFTQNHLLYIVCLACLDITVEICYVLIFTVAIVYEHYQIPLLHNLWHQYVRPISALAQVSILASAYTIIVASAERYVSSKSSNLNKWIPVQRLIVISTACFIASILKGTVYFEIEVITYSDCVGFSRYHLSQSVLTSSWLYAVVWMFWIRNIFSVFLPFSLLLLLNLATVKNMSTDCTLFLLRESLTQVQDSTEEDVLQRVRQRRKKRDATRMLISLVTMYLITNTPNLLLTFWEHIHIDSLRDLANGLVYRYASDASSLLLISCTAVRLPVYYSCNGDIRVELHKYIPTFLRLRHQRQTLRKH